MIDVIDTMVTALGPMSAAAKHVRFVRGASPVDLMIGFLFEADLDRGWWQRDRRIAMPFAAGKDKTHPGFNDSAWLVTLHERALRFATLDGTVVPHVFQERWIPSWIASKDVTNVDCVRAAMARTISPVAIRRRLDRETGYATLTTPEDCLDASRVYPRKSVAARFCVAAADFFQVRRTG